MLLKFLSRRKPFPFDFSQGLVIVDATIEGPSGSYEARLALDTGASTSLIAADILQFIGYELRRQRILF